MHLLVMILSATILAAIMSVPSPAWAARKKEKAAQSQPMVKILLIGNSHSFNASEYLGDILNQCGYDAIVGNCYMFAKDMAFNYNSLVDDKQNHNYRKYMHGEWVFDDVSFKASVLDALKDETWDYVMIQNSLVEEGLPFSFKDGNNRNIAVEFANRIREMLPDTKVCYNMLWAYHNGYTTPAFSSYFDSDPERLYASILQTTQEMIAGSGAFDLIDYSGGVVELLETTRIGNDLLGGYYRGGQYYPNMGIHAGGRHGLYTSAMCVAHMMGADLTKVQEVRVDSNYGKCKSCPKEDLDLIRRAIDTVWKDPWRIQWVKQDLMVKYVKRSKNWHVNWQGQKNILVRSLPRDQLLMLAGS